MSHKFKYTDIKNRAYYFFDVMINIKNLDPNKIKTDEKSWRNIPIYFIGYVMFNDVRYVKIHRTNPSLSIE